MNNLFSIFDPSSFLGLTLNWLSILSGLIFLSFINWYKLNQKQLILMFIWKNLYNEFSPILNIMNKPGSMFLMMGLFQTIFFYNFLGLFPYMFTPTSHLSTTLSLALPLWSGYTFYSWVLQFNYMMSHLLPLGTPAGLMPLMVLIELISNIIRPLTLSIRLSANMIAGHLMLTLIASNMTQCSPLMVLITMSILILLITLEASVALIQAYVFSILNVLYINDCLSYKTIN